jgi:hypothetical protein
VARRRYLSTEISVDPKVAALGGGGLLPVLLYTWLIPHADDFGMVPADPVKLKLLVMPGLMVSTEELADAVEKIMTSGLMTRTDSGMLAFPTSTFYKYQTYVNEATRAKLGVTAKNTGKHWKTPEIAEERRKSPENTVSSSLSLSLSPSGRTPCSPPTGEPTPHPPEKPPVCPPEGGVELATPEAKGPTIVEAGECIEAWNRFAHRTGLPAIEGTAKQKVMVQKELRKVDCRGWRENLARLEANGVKAFVIEKRLGITWFLTGKAQRGIAMGQWDACDAAPRSAKCQLPLLGDQ